MDRNDTTMSDGRKAVWFVSPTSRSRLELEIKDADGIIATVYAAPDFDHEGAARFISIGPDILDALLDSVVALEELAAAWPKDSLPSGPVCVRMANAINNGNALIAKAGRK